MLEIYFVALKNWRMAAKVLSMNQMIDRMFYNSGKGRSSGRQKDLAVEESISRPRNPSCGRGINLSGRFSSIIVHG
ncbi:hypothetical protein RHMOL_Rhmol02G0126600 [Rhododendron molle]|uniref:Uncharacterized protein n=1 Tax=Rhododendron molle TaxID=49168 RepID=A0ACC0PRR4_RHOML|nr:hypothetical protein RHMOL_Rhmol02G0126600 [Rhododendron molle]